jgi:hypothetical protein
MAQVVTIDLYGPRTMVDMAVKLCLQIIALLRNRPESAFRDGCMKTFQTACSIWAQPLAELGVVLADHGYVQAEERDRKRNRNLLLLRRVHQEQPNEIFPAYKLATTLLHGHRRRPTHAARRVGGTD